MTQQTAGMRFEYVLTSLDTRSAPMKAEVGAMLSRRREHDGQ